MYMELYFNGGGWNHAIFSPVITSNNNLLNCLTDEQCLDCHISCPVQNYWPIIFTQMWYVFVHTPFHKWTLWNNTCRERKLDIEKITLMQINQIYTYTDRSLSGNQNWIRIKYLWIFFNWHFKRYISISFFQFIQWLSKKKIHFVSQATQMRFVR